MSTFGGCMALYIVINFLILRFICLSSFLVYFRKGSEYLKKETVQVFILLQLSLVLRRFFFFWVTLSYFFFHLCLLDNVRFGCSLISFSFSQKVLTVSWLNSSISSVVSLLPFFHHKHGTFFNLKFHSYIFTEDSDSFYKGFLFILGKHFDIINIHKI